MLLLWEEEEAAAVLCFVKSDYGMEKEKRIYGTWKEDEKIVQAFLVGSRRLRARKGHEEAHCRGTSHLMPASAHNMRTTGIEVSPYILLNKVHTFHISSFTSYIPWQVVEVVHFLERRG